MDSVIVRPAVEADLPAILDIYNEQVLNSTATFDIEPRAIEAQRVWAKQFQPPYALLVAEEATRVVAWGCLHPFGSKPGYRFTTENSLYVRVGRRGGGLGRKLLVTLIETAGADGFHTIVARIAGDNPGSVALHKSLGFEQVGRERQVGYKFERWLDVVVMQKMLA
jgi:phosphinothricin acetyltransferase